MVMSFKIPSKAAKEYIRAGQAQFFHRGNLKKPEGQKKQETLDQKKKSFKKEREIDGIKC